MSFVSARVSRGAGAVSRARALFEARAVRRRARRLYGAARLSRRAAAGRPAPTSTRACLPASQKLSILGNSLYE